MEGIHMNDVNMIEIGEKRVDLMSEGDGGEKGEEGKEEEEEKEETEGKEGREGGGGGEEEGDEGEYRGMSEGWSERMRESSVSGGKGRVSSDIQVLVKD